MIRTAIAAAAMIFAMGSAFAASDHYDPNDTKQPAASVDTRLTASIRKHEVAKPANVDTSMTTGAADSKISPDPGQGIWGN